MGIDEADRWYAERPDDESTQASGNRPVDRATGLDGNEVRIYGTFRVPAMAYSGDGAGRLIETVRELSLARTQDAVMAIVRRCARELTDADGATFVLRDGDLCFYAEEDAISPLWKGQRFPMDMCISGWVMLNREHVVIEDIYADPRIPADAYRPTFVKSLAMVPIRPEAPVGAIGAYWATHHHPSDDRIAALQALADSVSVTMENLQLCAMLEARVRELERSNQVKDQFLSMLSHELRTPLNAIVGWADLLAAGELPAEEFSVGIATIQRNVRLQARITDDLLDTTQIVSGNLKLAFQSLDLTKVLRSAIHSVKVLPIPRASRSSFRSSARRSARSRATPSASSRPSGTCSPTPSSSRQMQAASRCDSSARARAPGSTSRTTAKAFRRPPYRPSSTSFIRATRP